MSVGTNQAIDDWIEQLSENNMPIFSATVTNVTNAVNSEDTSAADVAQVVLQDASLTSRLLKMANSFYFNPGKQQINTVSKAVMVLGFDQVRALTLSLVLVDSLGRGRQRQKLIEEMAQSFHAATQAQQLAKKLKVRSPEDIFVATLLSRLGNMAFWAFGDERAEALLQKLDASAEPTEAESQVLGFSLTALTRGLSKSWSLGQLLDDFVNERDSDERILLIQCGRDLAEAAQQGWKSAEAQQALQSIAERLDMKVADIEAQAFSNARQAKAVTKLYGSSAASSEIPQPVYNLVEEGGAEIQEMAVDTEPTAADEVVIETLRQYPEPDTAVQLSVMQEITNTIQERPNMSIILEMVLEGIHRGVGMDRAMFAILNPQRTHLQCKYVLGEDSENLHEHLRIDIRRTENIFSQVIHEQQAKLLPADPKQLGGTISRETISLLGPPPYMVMPAIVRNKVIGIFLADRNASGRPLSEQDFLAFKQFCQQANMGLTFLAMQG